MAADVRRLPTLCKGRKEWGIRIFGLFARKGLGRLPDGNHETQRRSPGADVRFPSDLSIITGSERIFNL